MFKKILLVPVCLIIASLTAFTKYGSGVIGKLFPDMVCETYDGKKVSLPNETKNKYTLLGMAFSNNAEANLKTWFEPVYNRFIGVKSTDNDPLLMAAAYDVNIYFIPMFTGVNKLAAKQSKEKIKSQTDKELHPHLLFYEGNKTYKEELDFEKKELPYFFVLDKSGKIVYATSGPYDDKKLDKVIDILDDAEDE